MLTFEIILAATLFFLILTTATAYIRRTSSDFRNTGIRLGWLEWSILATTWTQSSLGGEPEIAVLAWLLAVPMLFVVALPLSIGALWDMLINFRRYIPAIFGVGALSVILYLGPFVFWEKATISEYNTARSAALLLTVCSVFVAYMVLKSVLPAVPDPESPYPSDYEVFFYIDDEFEGDDLG